MKLNSDFADALPALYSRCQPQPFDQAAWAVFNRDYAATLGVQRDDNWLARFSGRGDHEHTIAQAYSGISSANSIRV